MQLGYVRFVPIADMTKFLFYQHIGSSEQRRRYCEPKRFGGFQVHDQLIFCRSLYREVGWFLTFKNAIDVARRAAVLIGFIGSIGCEATGIASVRLNEQESR